MSFWRRTPEEKAARAALKAEKERLYVARAQAKTLRARAAIARVGLKATKIAGRERITEAKTRRAAVRLQRSEELQEARYITAIDRLDRDRRRGKAKTVRVRSSPRARRHRRSRPR